MSLNETYLIADCGHATTTVALFKTVADSYRLISRAQAASTITDPIPNALVGLQEAIRQLEKNTGHDILSDGDFIRNTTQAGRGVDHFEITTSAAPPVRLAIVAPHVNDESIDSVKRLMQEASTEAIEVFATGDGRTLQMRIDEMGQLRPDLIVISSGPNKRAKKEMMELGEAVRFAQRQMARSDRARLIYCGHQDLQETVADALTDEFSLIVTEHVRPKPRKEVLGPLREMIRAQVQEIKLNRVPGMSEVISWGSAYPSSTVDALIDVVQYRASVREGQVLLVELENDGLTLIFANGKETHVSIRPELGIGKPLASLTAHVGWDELLCWLPEEVVDEAAVRQSFQDYLINQSLYPDMIPMVKQEFSFLQAIMRAVIARGLADALTSWGMDATNPLPLQTVIVRGRSLTLMPRNNQIIHLILDAIQPIGITSVVLDRYGVLPLVGKLAEKNSLAAVQVAESGVLLDLGWTVGIKGFSKKGRAVQVRVDFKGSGHIEADIDWGSIEILSMPATVTGDITISPGFFTTVGTRMGRKEVLEDVGGSLVGVVVDARGRPIKLPSNEKKRSQLMEQWIVDIGG